MNRRRSQLRLALLAVTIGLTGCVPFGEGVIRVRGEVRSAQTGELLSGCTSELLSPSGKVWESTTPLDPQFQRMFTVAPGDAIYTLAIACPGFRTQDVPVARSSAGDRVLEQDLGRIELLVAAE